jgi:hypothetical protein
MIKKWRIELAEKDGQPAIKTYGKVTQKQVAMLKKAKQQIIEGLQRREREMAEWEAHRQAEREAEKQAILSGEKPIQLQYHDGEYLSDWEVK